MQSESRDPAAPMPAVSPPDGARDGARPVEPAPVAGTDPTGHPDPNATGGLEPLPDMPHPVLGHAGDRTRDREDVERQAARRRGRERRVRREAGHDPEVGRADPALAHRAFAAFAENVRDYAIFLMDADGIIRFWGEGARLMKWWTKEEAEGGHLRLLYPSGGSEDGTAEGHLFEAALTGESISEGHRVRGDGSTFWARITLTALRDDEGTLLGFAKTTIDRTARRAADATRELAAKVAELEAARGARADLRAETAVLKEEVAVLRQELAERDRSRT